MRNRCIQERKLPWQGRKVRKNLKLRDAKTIYEISCIGVRVNDIAMHYKLKQPSVYNIIRRFRDEENKRSKIKKMRRLCKLSGRGMRLFKKYVSNNCFDRLHSIAAKFNENSGLQISERSRRRYISKLKLKNCIATRKLFLSSHNIEARIVWASTHQS